MGLHCWTRSSTPPRTQLRIRLTGEAKTHLIIFSRHSETKKLARAGRYCEPPTVISTHLGPQHRHSTCKTSWSIRSQPIGDKGKVIGRRRLTNHLHLRQEVATVIWVYLRAVPPSSSGVNDVEPPFAIAVLHTAELAAPPQERRLPRRGMAGRRPGRSRGQHSDDCETNSPEAAED